jgi:hypothetical protein
MAFPPPDITATVTFFTAEQGGRRVPTAASGRYGCPAIIDGEYCDVFFNLAETGPIAPGQTITAGLRFLSPEFALPRLSVGKDFSIWEGKVIGTCRVLAIHVAT